MNGKHSNHSTLVILIDNYYLSEDGIFIFKRGSDINGLTSTKFDLKKKNR